MFRNTARCLDALFVIAGGLLAHRMRFSTPIALSDTEHLLIAFNCVLVLLMFPGFGVYEPWRGKALPSMLLRVAAAWLVVVATALVLAFTLHRMDALSRLWFGYSTLISGALIIVTKCLVHVSLRSVRRRGMNYRTVAIVGAPGFARTLLAHLDHALVDVVGLPTLNLSATPVSSPQMWPKLIFDRLFAAAALLALAPVFVVLAIGIKLSSPGPVFFRQTRKGVDGQPFAIYKFRSMTVHHEAPGQVTQAARNDARVTKLGGFMRRTSLDELPQFLNVLLGQMSVVGPRPHALEHDDLYKDQVYGYMNRYRIKPGITGWAQVNGYRGATTKVEKMEARVKFDLFYIDNWSFWFDMKIVLITIFKGFVGRNAF